MLEFWAPPVRPGAPFCRVPPPPAHFGQGLPWTHCMNNIDQNFGLCTFFSHFNPIQIGLECATRKKGGQFLSLLKTLTYASKNPNLNLYASKNKEKLENCYGASNFENQISWNLNSEMRSKMGKIIRPNFRKSWSWYIKKFAKIRWLRLYQSKFKILTIRFLEILWKI